MIQAERELCILEHLKENRIASVQAICDITGASPATVRRDLKSLSERGHIIKTRGGVRVADEDRAALSVTQEDAVRNQEKRKIAEKAVSLIRPGDAVFLGAGVTCGYIAEEIRAIANVTVVTTSISGAAVMAGAPNLALVLLGGRVRKGAGFVETVGEYEDMAQLMGRYHFNKSFISINGVDIKSGYSVVNYSQVPLYTKVQKASDHFYVLTDSAKFDKTAFVNLCGLDQIENVIVPDRIDSKYIDYFVKHKINYIVQQV